jgi:hypothetical protein
MSREVEKVKIVLDNGTELECEVEERVYPDRTCGQYEGGWHVAYGPGEDDGYFVSDEGTVYEVGTDTVVGVAPVVKRQAEQYERMLMSEPPSEEIKSALDKLLQRDDDRRTVIE